MSDSATRKPRSVINPIRSLNQLRAIKGLPKISNKAKTIKVSPEVKLEITKQEIEKLFPEALTTTDYQFTEDQGKKLVKAVDERISKIKAAKEPMPAVTASIKEIKAPAAKKRAPKKVKTN